MHALLNTSFFSPSEDTPLPPSLKADHNMAKHIRLRKLHMPPPGHPPPPPS